jgi:hypothetical protein
MLVHRICRRTADRSRRITITLGLRVKRRGDDMAEPSSRPEGTLVRIQVRHPGTTVFQQTYLVSHSGDLSRAKGAALTMAVLSRPDLRRSDLLIRVDPVS